MFYLSRVSHVAQPLDFLDVKQAIMSRGDWFVFHMWRPASASQRNSFPLNDPPTIHVHLHRGGKHSHPVFGIPSTVELSQFLLTIRIILLIFFSPLCELAGVGTFVVKAALIVHRV